LQLALVHRRGPWFLSLLLMFQTAVSIDSISRLPKFHALVFFLLMLLDRERPDDGAFGDTGIV
jgi:hypothetical protein